MVEDNEVNGRMGLKLLSIAGYSTELAEDGAVALEMITKPGVKYDIVLMNCQVHPALLTPNLPDACDGRLGMHATNTSAGNGREVSRAHTNHSSDCKCRR